MLYACSLLIAGLFNKSPFARFWPQTTAHAVPSLAKHSKTATSISVARSALSSKPVARLPRTSPAMMRVDLRACACVMTAEEVNKSHEEAHGWAGSLVDAFSGKLLQSLYDTAHTIVDGIAALFAGISLSLPLASIITRAVSALSDFIDQLPHRQVARHAARYEQQRALKLEFRELASVAVAELARLRERNAELVERNAHLERRFEQKEGELAAAREVVAGIIDEAPRGLW